MKKYNKTILIGLLVWFTFPEMVNGQNILISLEPVKKDFIQNNQILVPVMVDMSGVQEKLGSYTAELTWNTKALKPINHYAGTSPGFGNPFVNTENKETGRIEFTAVNVYGGSGNLNIMNFVFEVLDESAFERKIEIKFSAMASSQSFSNLLPYIKIKPLTDKQNITIETKDKTDY